MPGAKAKPRLAPSPASATMFSFPHNAVELLERITDGFIAVDKEWRVVHLNGEAERASGLRRQEAIGKSYWELFPESVNTPLEHAFLKAAREQVRVEIDSYYPPWRRWFHVKIYPAQDGGVSAFFDDITDRKTIAESLRRSEERLRAITETTPEWVSVIAPDGRLLHVNSPGLGMIGATDHAQIIGRSIYTLIAPEFRDAFIQYNERVCSGDRGAMAFDLVTLKGERRNIESLGAPVEQSDGTTAHIAIAHDVKERELRDTSGLLLGAIVDSSDDAIISKNLDGIITSWNKAAERLFGYTADEVIGKSITIVIPPDRLEEEPNILSRLKRGERVDHFETVRRRKDGRLIDISLTISPVRDANGKVIGASKIARDISGRKRAEEAIRVLNTQLTADLAAMTRMQHLSARLVQAADIPELLGEILDAAISTTEADMGIVQLVEDGALKIVAQRGFEAPFLEFFDVVHDGEAVCGTALQRKERVIVDDVEHSPIFAGTPALQAMLAAGAKAVHSTPLLARSGQVVGVFSTHYRAPQRPGDRETRLLDILARLAADLVERKHAEEALVASEARFRQLADSMPQIVWTARSDGVIDYYNERWYQFTGSSRDSFGDMSWMPFVHPEDVRRTWETWYNSVKSGDPYRTELRLWDGSENRWRWFIARALPVRDPQGAIIRWFGTTTDIDEQKRVQDELRHANADLEQFAYSASHDLQEPLRSVRIYSELLATRSEGKLDGQALQFLHYLQSGAVRMENLVRDLLEYTQVSRLDVPSEVTNANEALKTALANLDGAILESGAKVHCDPLPAVRVHSTHLRQILQNLIGNAIKYRSPDRPIEVHVTCEHQNGSWVFAVGDNGIGIPQEYRDYIFGLFKRLHSGAEYSGTGIGLAICQRIVERYQGRIWVDSEPGRGSTFRFTIPSDERRLQEHQDVK